MRGAVLVRAAVALGLVVAGLAARAAPFATTYHGSIAHSGIAADAPDGAAFTLTLVLDNGAADTANQSWHIGDVTCGFWRWRVDAARSVTVALDMSAGLAQGSGNLTTDASGALTAVYDAVHTGGPLAFGDYAVSGLSAGSAMGWAADGAAQIFGLMAGGGGGRFDDGSGTPAGGRADEPRPLECTAALHRRLRRKRRATHPAGTAPPHGHHVAFGLGAGAAGGPAGAERDQAQFHE